MVLALPSQLWVAPASASGQYILLLLLIHLLARSACAVTDTESPADPQLNFYAIDGFPEKAF